LTAETCNRLLFIRGEEIVLKPALDVKKFIAKLKGCVHGADKTA